VLGGGIDGMKEFVKSRVAKYYWEDDINCTGSAGNVRSAVFSE
jgi:hypothetical protein